MAIMYLVSRLRAPGSGADCHVLQVMDSSAARASTWRTCGVVRVRMGEEVMLAAGVLETESINDEVRAPDPFQVLYLGCHGCNALNTIT